MLLAAIDGDTLIAAGAVIGAALITGPIVFVLKRYDRRNSEQHRDAQVAREHSLHLIQSLHGKVDHHGKLMSDHLSWHAHPPAQVVVVTDDAAAETA